MTTIGLIAPNPDVYEIAARLTGTLGLDGKVVLRVASMEDGVVVAREFERLGVEVIVTRGGTGELIKNSDVRVPLVDIPISGNEIVAAIQEARQRTGLANPKLAILAYRTMSYGIELFTQLTGLDMRIYERSSGETLEAVMERVVQDGADAFIGGKMSRDLAVRRGICGVVLETTEASVRTALVEAEKVAALRRLEETRLQRMRMVLDLFPDGVMAVDNEGRLQLANPSAFRLLGLTPEAVGSKVDAVLPNLDLASCLDRGETHRHVIYPFKNTSLVVTLRPIRIREDITGAVITMQEAGNIRELEAKLRDTYAKGLTATHHFRAIAGESETIRATVRKAELYAATKGTILITGETGTGKEVFAQSIHNASLCRQGPFVAVNCAALPPSLLESELFGYEEGAFTGAMRNGKPGYFELAHGGTIFLDEILEIDRYGQTRLLRVLQERRSMRLGGGRYIQLDVRVIAASNRNLKVLADRGEFRPDLYYRLSALTLHLPPLRKRPGDVKLLAQHFASATLGLYEGESHFTPRALSCLAEQEWPGNVRELQNVIERLCLFYANKPFDLDAVQAALTTDPWDDDDRETANEPSEKDRILAALRSAGGNQGRAAKELGINPSTLYRKMRRYGIQKF
ncbi:MAG: sigma 54-interacting transcriptional regulator [Planctomycetes bacterium]|nr:sigma 54-interacting transcriptional regulator [Planctomycetota bacterium]